MQPATPRHHMVVTPIRTCLFGEGDDLFRFVIGHLPRVRDSSIIAVTSKIVSLSQRRTHPVVAAADMERLVRAESDITVPTDYGWMTVRDGLVMASAGIDASNARGKLVLLPRDSFRVARTLRRALQRHYGVKQLGVLITDSRTLPFRAGSVGIALGYAGFRGVRNYRGATDLFGREFRYARADIADGVAAAAVLAMGEGDEQQPLALIEGLRVRFCDRVARRELQVSIEGDMYRPLYDALPRAPNTGKR